jgi:hypothetical protein
VRVVEDDSHSRLLGSKWIATLMRTCASQAKNQSRSPNYSLHPNQNYPLPLTGNSERARLGPGHLQFELP